MGGGAIFSHTTLGVCFKEIFSSKIFPCISISNQIKNQILSIHIFLQHTVQYYICQKQKCILELCHVKNLDYVTWTTKIFQHDYHWKTHLPYGKMFHISFESGIIFVLLNKSKKQENTMKFFIMLSFNEVSLKMYLVRFKMWMGKTTRL